MLDIKFIRENQSLIAEASRKKRLDFKVEELIAIDDRRLGILGEVESLRAKQNEASAQIVSVGAEEKAALLVEMKNVKDLLQTKEEELKEIMKDWQKQMVQVPNIPDMSVPEGDDDSANAESKTWGDKTVFDFTARDHVELMTMLDMADFERGTKVAGFRGYFLKNAGARLSFALWQLAFDMLQDEGFAPVMAPSLVRREALLGTGYLPQGEEDLYKTQDADYLAGTAEVGLMALHMDEIVDSAKLPIKYAGFSPCFRREAGSHGKDTKGLIRVHEFFKIEQLILCEANHAESVAWHEKLLATAEKYMQTLGIPYRVVVNCTGDLGLGQVKKYDIEAWVPGEQKYRETHSISYFHDFQTRRLNLKYRDAEGKLRFVHSLNGTMSATPRLLVSLVENYQQADGSIKVPLALQKYVGQEIIRANQ
ncbi:MAG: seryl-tRNA synthetase [Patescibacteria group bacterium]|nr:seryl-tRNA synthetase [Patescibacteria group bacterium]